LWELSKNKRVAENELRLSSPAENDWRSTVKNDDFMNKTFLTVLMTVCVLPFGGCSYYLNNKSGTEKRVDLIISHAYKKYENQEVVFERLTMEFSGYHEPPVVLTGESKKDSSRLELDGSQVNTLFDGFGNKTETRIFFKDPLIKFVVIRTEPAGEKEAFVYCQNGEVRPVPVEFLDEVLTAATTDIARSVQISEGRRENEFLAGLQKKQTPPSALVKPGSENDQPAPTATGTPTVTAAKPDSASKTGNESPEPAPQEK
jgi:hypothetical protein